MVSYHSERTRRKSAARWRQASALTPPVSSTCAAARTRLALLQLFLVKGFKLYSFTPATIHVTLRNQFRNFRIIANPAPSSCRPLLYFRRPILHLITQELQAQDHAFQMNSCNKLRCRLREDRQGWVDIFSFILHPSM